MAQNSDNIAILRPKVAGAAYVAPNGTTCPTSASATATSFNSLGWLSSDGIAMSIARETQDLLGFGGDTALTIQTSHDVTFTLTPLEMNEYTAKATFGDANVTASEGVVTTINVNSKESGDHPWMFDMMGRDNQLVRVVVPKGKVTETGEVAFKHDAASMAPQLTIKALPDASGNKAYIYTGTAD